jgi:hypothetical protein
MYGLAHVMIALWTFIRSLDETHFIGTKLISRASLKYNLSETLLPRGLNPLQMNTLLLPH